MQRDLGSDCCQTRLLQGQVGETWPLVDLHHADAETKGGVAGDGLRCKWPFLKRPVAARQESGYCASWPSYYFCQKVGKRRRIRNTLISEPSGKRVFDCSGDDKRDEAPTSSHHCDESDNNHDDADTRTDGIYKCHGERCSRESSEPWQDGSESEDSDEA